jgi:lipoprotein-anchoring transpeptidase ErfK/SrfK
MIVIRFFIAASCLGMSAASLFAQNAPPAVGPVDPTAATRRAVRAVPLPTKAGPEPIPIQPTTAVIRDRNARLQIFLDRQQFGPGKIDGSWGLFARQAWKRYQQAKGQPAVDPVASLPSEVATFEPLYATYTVTAADATLVGEIKGSLAEKSKMKMLPYTSLSAMVSERYHCSPEFLVRLNPGLKLNGLKVGQTLTVPNVVPFDLLAIRAERHRIDAMALERKRQAQQLALASTNPNNPVPVPPPQPGDPPPANPDRYNLRVSTVDKVVEIREGTRLVASFPVTPGSDTLPTPKGSWVFRSKVYFPEFRWDDAMLNTGKRSEQFYLLPPGPNNPVGIMWMGISKDGIGLHGTNNPNTIGRATSHGCMRLANWDAVRVASYVEKGTHLLIE